MGLLTLNFQWTTKPSSSSATHLLFAHYSFTCWRLNSPVDPLKTRPPKIRNVRAFAKQKSAKQLRRQSNVEKDLTPEIDLSSLDKNDRRPADLSPQGDENFEGFNKRSAFKNLDLKDSVTISSRSAVLQACTVTSGLIAALGVILRQVSHVASSEGLPILDCSTEISFSFETWHLQLIAGLVILISSFRYMLLKTWPDFAESSEAANRQVLTSLQPLDYMIVAVLPGFSEELLFRGALLPLFGVSWKSALLVAAFFGVLHLGGGRKYSFAIWATFVGFVYGYATILSSSIVVPMASHAANNLVGGLVWRYTSEPSN